MGEEGDGRFPEDRVLRRTIGSVSKSSHPCMRLWRRNSSVLSVLTYLADHYHHRGCPPPILSANSRLLGIAYAFGVTLHVNTISVLFLSHTPFGPGLSVFISDTFNLLSNCLHERDRTSSLCLADQPAAVI